MYTHLFLMSRHKQWCVGNDEVFKRSVNVQCSVCYYVHHVCIGAISITVSVWLFITSIST